MAEPIRSVGAVCRSRGREILSYKVARAERRIFHGTRHPASHEMGKANAGVSVTRVDLGAATSTSVDMHEAQWRAGVNRQAQPAAGSHQLAASEAAAAKRKAGAMSGDEKAAAQRLNADRRNAAKRAKRAAAAAVQAAAPLEAMGQGRPQLPGGELVAPGEVSFEEAGAERDARCAWPGSH